MMGLFKLFRLRRLAALVFLALAYGAVSVVYYSLPWEFRRPVNDYAPWIDQPLRKSGYRILGLWDGLGWSGSDCRVPLERSFANGPAYGGLPSQGFKLFGRLTVLENQGFTVGYSEKMCNPLWASYRVFDVPSLETGPRPSSFKADARTQAKVKHDDYTNSGYDRGHMAPNFAIATRYGAEGQNETFLMSNIIPQTPHVNRTIWKDLEMVVAKRYGRYFKEVWVVTGPVFREPVGRLGSGVAIPAAYYKIMADEDAGALRVMAFLVESDCPPYTRPRMRLVSVDRIEELTGLDFFPELPKEVQVSIESRTAGRLWPWLVPGARYHLFGETR